TDSTALSLHDALPISGQTVATLGDGPAVTLWKVLKSGQPAAYATIQDTTKRRPAAIALNPDGSVLAMAETNGQVNLWSTRSARRSEEHTSELQSRSDL